MNDIMVFFPRIKEQGIESHEVKKTLQSLIHTRDGSQLDEKLRSLFFDVLTIDECFFFQIKSDWEHHTFTAGSLQHSDNTEDIEFIESSIANYYIQNMLLAVLRHFGEPRRDSTQWRLLSCYFKLVFAYASLSCQHQSRAVKLCEQLRISLKPNAHQRLSFQKLAEFHQLKNYNLDLITTEILAFEQKLQEASTDGVELADLDSSDTMKAHFSDLRIIYQNASDPKPYSRRFFQRRNPRIKQRFHTETDLGDAESGSRSTQFVETEKPKEDDISSMAETEAIDNNFSPKQGTEFSAELQQTISKTNYLHAKRNGLGLPSNPRTASLELTQQSFAFIWQAFRRLLDGKEQRPPLEDPYEVRSKLDAYGTLLLVLLTGRSIAEVSRELHREGQHRTFIVSKKKASEFRINNKVETTLLRKSTAIKPFQLSKGREIILPLPQPLHQFIASKPRPGDRAIQAAMTEIKSHTGFTLKTHFNKALSTIIQNGLNQALHANIICGVSVTHYAPLYYTAFDSQAVLKTYQSAIELLVDKLPDDDRAEFADMFAPVFYAQHPVLGSQMAIREDKCALFFSLLHNNAMCFESSVKRLSSEQLTAQFNAYTLWLFHLINLLTGIRPVKHSPGFLNQFNLEYRIFWVSDKSASKKDVGRLIPICHFLHKAIENYLNYLQRFNDNYTPLNPDNPFPLTDIMASKRPLLHLFHLNKFKPITPYYVAQELQGFLNHNTNWLRHQLRTMLSQRNVPEYLICEVFGHEDWDIQMFEPNSDASIQQLQQLSTHLDVIADELQLKQVEV